MIKKFKTFSINEQLDSSKYSEIIQEVTDLIENTVSNNKGDFKEFVKSFNQNPNDIKIEGLINDSDIYDFYLKWRNDIDEILEEINFFQLVPSDNNIFGLYDYIIKGTLESIKEITKSL